MLRSAIIIINSYFDFFAWGLEMLSKDTSVAVARVLYRPDAIEVVEHNLLGKGLLSEPTRRSYVSFPFAHRDRVCYRDALRNESWLAAVSDSTACFDDTDQGLLSLDDFSSVSGQEPSLDDLMSGINRRFTAYTQFFWDSERLTELGLETAQRYNSSFGLDFGFVRTGVDSVGVFIPDYSSIDNRIQVLHIPVHLRR